MTFIALEMDSLVLDQILKDIEVLFSRETVQEWASQYGIKVALIGALSYYLLRRVRRPLAFSTLKGKLTVTVGVYGPLGRVHNAEPHF